MAPVPPDLSDAAILKRRRTRNWAVLIVLLAMSALFYAIAIVKMGGVLHTGTP